MQFYNILLNVAARLWVAIYFDKWCFQNQTQIE